MLKVLPVQTKELQAELCRRCGIPFLPDLLAYAATVDEELVGICQFKLTDKGGELHHLAKVLDRPEPEDPRARAASDFEAMFVMGRGALNFIDLCGVHNASFVGEVTDETLIRAVGFQKTESGTYEVDLTGFFTDHCHEHGSKDAK